MNTEQLLPYARTHHAHLSDEEHEMYKLASWYNPSSWSKHTDGSDTSLTGVGKELGADLAMGSIPGVGALWYGGKAVDNFKTGHWGQGILNSALGVAGAAGLGGAGAAAVKGVGLAARGIKGLSWFNKAKTVGTAAVKGAQAGRAAGVAANTARMSKYTPKLLQYSGEAKWGVRAAKQGTKLGARAAGEMTVGGKMTAGARASDAFKAAAPQRRQWYNQQRQQGAFGQRNMAVAPTNSNYKPLNNNV